MTESVDFSNVNYDEWCHYHNRLEPNGKNDHAACMECGHVYRTEKELRKAYDRYIIGIRRFWIFGGKPSTHKIWICPLCGHDF